MLIKISVPGKIILSGEHAVVYGKPAIAAAVDRRLTVTLQSRDDGKKNIHTDAGDTKLIKAAIKVVQDRLKLRKNTNDLPRRAPRCYIGVRALRGRYTFFTNGYELGIKSGIPIGAGMGSSAAIAVGVVTAFMGASTGEARLDLERINKLAYEVEKIQHDAPSGIDNSTVTFGGFLWYRREFEFLKTFWKLQFKIAKKMDNFYLINTGRPDETTGEMVQRVRERFCKKKMPISTNFLQILDDIESVTKQVALGIRGEDKGMLMEAIRQNERLLEKLGVVGEFAQKIVRELEKAGGAAKISGAGGIKNKSGLLLVYHRNRDKVERIARKHKLDYFSAKLRVEGVRIEKMII